LYIINLKVKAFILPAIIVLVILNEICLGPLTAFLKNLFPSQFRYRATSLSCGLGLSVSMGLTPLIDSALFKLYNNNFVACAYWLIFIGLGLLFSCVFVKQAQ